MSDTTSLATVDVLTKVLPPAAFTDANLFSLAICRAVNLSLEHGNSDGSCVAYVHFSMIAGPHFGNYKAGFRFGRLGYELVEKRGLERFKARTYLWFGQFVIPWTKHVRAGRDLMRRPFEAANKTGDLIVAAYSCAALNTNLLAAGDPLPEVQREAENGLEFAQKARFGLVIDCITPHLGIIRTLRGPTPKFGSFDHEGFDELVFEQNLESQPVLALNECRYWIRKLQARFVFGDYASAVHASLRAQQLLWTSPSQFETAEYHFYGALSRATCCDSAFPDRHRQDFEALIAHHRQLEVWAENCPENFENRAALVGAEIARQEGRDFEAMRLYEEAIRSARANGFVHNEAVANELAARFYAARGFEQIAELYLRNARHCYLSWGADGKLSAGELVLDSRRTIGTSVEQLDLGTAIKASQAVSGEIVLENLIKTLMVIAVEHGGAERGLLILPGGEEHRIEAEARTGRDKVEVSLRQSLVMPSELPESLFRYVIRTQERVILDDATAQSLFSEDEYVRQRRPRSVLCLPLVKQGKLMGMLYLENNLAPGVFTPKRLAMLELLASQAAISLDHARVYAELARENSERKRAEEELRRSEAFLAQGQRISHTGSWRWQVATGAIYWSEEHFRIFEFDPETDKPSHALFMERIHPEDRASFEELLNRAVRDESDFENQYRIVLPDGSIKFLRSMGQALVNTAGELEFIGTVMDVTDLKRAEEMQVAIAREREMFAQQRATQFARANEALRGCLDTLASVPELDEFLGQSHGCHHGATRRCLFHSAIV
jgi:GAF domain-containing protein